MTAIRCIKPNPNDTQLQFAKAALLDEAFFSGGRCLDGLNRYAYCHNNPVKYTDPTGHLHFNGTEWVSDLEDVDIDYESTDPDPEPEPDPETSGGGYWEYHWNYGLSRGSDGFRTWVSLPVTPKPSTPEPDVIEIIAGYVELSIYLCELPTNLLIESAITVGEMWGTILSGIGSEMASSQSRPKCNAPVGSNRWFWEVYTPYNYGVFNMTMGNAFSMLSGAPNFPGLSYASSADVLYINVSSQVSAIEYIINLCAAISKGGGGISSGDKSDNKFDPDLKQDQKDNDWNYHWDKNPHIKRGGAAHWDRGHRRMGWIQEWSPDGIHWYPK